MNNEEIHSTIVRLFREKEALKDIGEEDDFFEMGVSSLTVVELQILIEKELNLSVQTSELMRAPTIKVWVDLYTELAS